MNWGIFVGLDTLVSIVAILLFIIVGLAILWVFISTPLGFIPIIGLTVYGLYRLFR